MNESVAGSYIMGMPQSAQTVVVLENTRTQVALMLTLVCLHVT